MSKPIAFKDTNLFKPLKLGQIELKHRVVLAPLTRLRNNPETYEPEELAIEYYAQRSQRPGTLIITEGIITDETGVGYAPGLPGAWTSSQVAKWKKVFDAIHANGSFVVAQLFHLGRQAHADALKKLGRDFLAPSPIFIDGDQSAPTSEESAKKAGVKIRALTIEEIEKIQDNVVSVAKNLLRAGADGIQVHLANGYLFNQFLDPISNQRTDKYGGSIENRSRFALEIIDKLDAELGSLEKVSVRISPYGIYGGLRGTGSDPTLLAQYAHLLGELEVRARNGKPLQFIDLVDPRFNEQYASKHVDSSANDFVGKIWSGPIIKAGNFGNDFDALREAIKDDRVAIAIGRNFIVNPDLPDRLENGWELTPYDRSTFYGGGARGYTDYTNYQK